MATNCFDDLFWDGLVKKCLHCDVVCRQPHVVSRCTTYCESALCKALPGHFYDVLLKKCLRCADICGKHTAECSEHCQTVSTKKPLLAVTARMSNSRGPAALEDSAILLYSLLALSLVLLLTSLSLALAVFLRRRKVAASEPGPAEGTDHRQECAVQPGQELGFPGRQSSKDYAPSYPANREPSDDSIPTETCVCVHCFPDLTALGQTNGKPLRAPFSFYQPAVLQSARIHTSSDQEVYDGAAVR
ncbi:tumor necrosis factor receptor superfamily member 13B [Embiotoca jacksoni]|uniref:tumor necrosis factor receptor superfamily member 13B n=1 Tax=Embiotoca jacksoni TaxID=100190 RepID=UPI0037038F41